jgi:hypothetical protein
VCVVSCVWPLCGMLCFVGALGLLGLGGPGSQQQEHTQHHNVWVVALVFGMAREGQPNKQSNNPNLDPAMHCISARLFPAMHFLLASILCLGWGPGALRVRWTRAQQQEHTQTHYGWVVDCCWGLAREGQPTTQTNNPHLHPAMHLISAEMFPVMQFLLSII